MLYRACFCVKNDAKKNQVKNTNTTGILRQVRERYIVGTVILRIN